MPPPGLVSFLSYCSYVFALLDLSSFLSYVFALLSYYVLFVCASFLIICAYVVSFLFVCASYYSFLIMLSLICLRFSICVCVCVILAQGPC